MARAGSGGPLVAGAAFAIAWTPCVGPTLATILSAAALQETVGESAILLTFYPLGLAAPFCVRHGGPGALLRSVGLDSLYEF